MTPTVATPQTIDSAEVLRMQRDEPAVRILDVRTSGEFQSVHIPGSYNVPLDTLQEHVGDLADIDRPVVLVCQSGGRATDAHRRLTSAGKTSVHILDGGMEAWLDSGGGVVRSGNERWAMERQVRLVAGTIALLGIVASLYVPKAKWLSAGVGAGLTFSALSNTCAMASVLGKLPYNKGADCDIAGVLEELNQTGG